MSIDATDMTYLNPLSANPIKWPNTFKQFVGKLPTNWLSVFSHFVDLALKELKKYIRYLHFSKTVQACSIPIFEGID